MPHFVTSSFSRSPKVQISGAHAGSGGDDAIAHEELHFAQHSLEAKAPVQISIQGLEQFEEFRSFYGRDGNKTEEEETDLPSRASHPAACV
jgi:hypothetical protein